MPAVDIHISLPYERTSDETAILLARKYLIEEIRSLLDDPDEVFLAQIAEDEFGIAPDAPTVERAVELLLSDAEMTAPLLAPMQLPLPFYAGMR